MTLVHSNDVYGALKPRRSGDHYLGGMASRITLIHRLKSKGPVLVLDAGDAMGPGPLCTLDQGKTMISLMRMAGYAALTPGNHDLSYGSEVLESRRGEAQFPFLIANINPTKEFW